MTRENLIREAAHADGSKAYTNEEFEGTIAALQAFAAARPGIVLAEVATLRQAP